MHPTAEALLTAHTQFILTQLSGKSLSTRIQEETQIAFLWMHTTPINKITTEVLVRDFIVRNILDTEPTQALSAHLAILTKAAINSSQNKNTKLEDLLNAKEYDSIIDRLISLEDIRKEWIHAIMQNPAVTQLISDLVYNGVKNYLLEDGGLAKKLPGMSSLMKMGKGMMERMGSLDSALESALKNYVQRNTRATMELSERLVEKTLETDKLKTISRQFWQKIKGTSLSTIFKPIKDTDIDDVANISTTLWNHFRQTSYAKSLLSELVHEWFEQWGSLTIAEVLQNLNIDQARLTQEIEIFLEPLMTELLTSGLLEARIKLHLERFYNSDIVNNIIENS